MGTTIRCKLKFPVEVRIKSPDITNISTIAVEIVEQAYNLLYLFTVQSSNEIRQTESNTIQN